MTAQNFKEEGAREGLPREFLSLGVFTGLWVGRFNLSKPLGRSANQIFITYLSYGRDGGLLAGRVKSF